MLNKFNILLVEDEKSHQLIILKALGVMYNVDVVDSYYSAREKIQSENSYDLFLLDIMLPDGDGYELCTHIKMQDNTRDLPVIFLTSKQEVKSKVLGFSLGADDYIVKPCNPLELKARVDSKITKFKKSASEKSNFQVGDLVLELDTQMTYCMSGDEKSELDLTPLEFKLCLYLARHMDQVLTREQILDGVWGQTTNVLDRSVDTYIASLRKKLGKVSSYIKSVHGVGYRFTVDSAAASKAS